MASISAEFPLAQSVSIGRIPYARCMMDSRQREDTDTLWNILPDGSTFVHYMANMYHIFLHQDDLANRFVDYNLETEQKIMLIILTRLIQNEKDQYGDYIEGLCLDILKNR